MTTVPSEALRGLASECVTVVAQQHNRELDWTVRSLAELDAVCAELLADGPLAGERLELWWKLVGAYTGEVLVRVYSGQWIEYENTSGAYVVSIDGMTAMPFSVAWRVLNGEEFKSLASFARVFPTLAAQQKENG
ncbi:hypothetical protein [Amycolatopsis samaneae]|uniref:DUF3806 domain-containing protein n=1 Tax=Amycolatopsis samaneae TaxID=664691 RepID=A0ABW5GNN0_9PSEU